MWDTRFTAERSRRCATDAWGALRDSNPLYRDHNPAPSHDGQRHQWAVEDSNLCCPGVWSRRSAAELIAL